MTTGLSSLLGLLLGEALHTWMFSMLRIESQTHSWAGDTCFTGGQTAETHRGYNGKTGFKPTSGCLASTFCLQPPSEESQLEFLWNFREKLLMFPVCFSLAPGETVQRKFWPLSECQRAPFLGLRSATTSQRFRTSLLQGEK